MAGKTSTEERLTVLNQALHRENQRLTAKLTQAETSIVELIAGDAESASKRQIEQLSTTVSTLEAKVRELESRSSSASAEKAVRSFRDALSKKFHPDTAQGQMEKLLRQEVSKEINSTYDVVVKDIKSGKFG